MKQFFPRLPGFAIALAAVAPPLASQSNAIPGTDVELGILGTGQGVSNGDPRVWGRDVAFPNGTIGVSIATTSCNVGTVDVPWISTDTGNPMGDNHPYIASLFARESGGRLEQISGYSDVKHGFFALTNEQCGGNCNQGPFGGGDVLGQGCSDTYGTFNNGDQYWLAPADEIDPWLGSWDPFGSHFDRGEPDVGAPANMNGQRSLTSGQVAAFDELNHRVQIQDSDLDVAGADFYYQGYYVIRGEPEANRWNNFRTRALNVTMGGEWNFDDAGDVQLGTVLQHWDGATITSEVNGNDDGRVYVAVVVTGPTDGLYHYEYAVHNRDAHRKVGSLRIPICPDASVSGVGFHDVDDDGGNDWSLQQVGSELVFSTGDNPIRWNSFFNFWFDSDAAPGTGAVVYEPFDPGPGSDQVAIAGTRAPLNLFNFQAGAGCSFGTPPSVVAVGSPPQATLGNATFAAEVSGNDAGAALAPFAGFFGGVTNLGGGCELQMTGSIGAGIVPLGMETADGSGLATVPLPIPALPGLEGILFTLQGFSFRNGGGPVGGDYDLTDALRVRVGDTVSGCP